MNLTTRNIGVACLVILLVHMAFYPASSIQNIAITDSGKDINERIGFYSQGTLYVTSILGSLATSFLHDIIGVKATYGIGVGLYGALYISVAILQEWAIYLASPLTGFGLGIFWVIGPRIIAGNSTKDTLLRNFSLYQFLFTTSILMGSTWDYFYIEQLTRITNKHRIGIYTVCTIISAVAAIIAAIFINDPPSSIIEKKRLEEHALEELNDTENYNPETTILDNAAGLSRCQIMKIMMKKAEFWYFTVFVIYCGTVTSYIWLTFTTCIGATFTQRKVIALAGIVCGLCEMLGSILWERVAAKSENLCTIMLAFVASIAYILSFLMFPGDAPHNPEPVKSSYINPSMTMVLTIAALLGLSEAGFAIRCNSSAGRVFHGNEDVGYTFLNIMWCLTTGILFFLGPWTNIQVFCVSVELLMILTVVFKVIRLNKL